MNYIYMSGDGFRTAIGLRGNRLVYFKAGYSKHPVFRGAQLSYEARRKFGIEYSFNVKEAHTYPVGDTDTAKRVEAYVLGKIAELAKERIGTEHFLITKSNRKKCYMLLPQWCTEALAQ